MYINGVTHNYVINIEYIIMEKFQQNIKSWVKLDGELKDLNDQSKQLRTNKSELQTNIYEFVQSNDLESSTVKISDGKLKFTQTKQTTPLSLGFIETCLLDKIKNEDTVSDLMEYIKSKREPKYTSEIKRYYD
tara:strand:+ start:371 stop:769 length:399 start_codon:yes stop_codon:yes gene_type:complete